MSAPIIWIAIPAAAGLLFWFFRQRFGQVIVYSVILCLLLAAFALIVPIGKPVHIGPLSFVIDSTLAIGGRRLVLDSNSRTFLVFIYALCAFWFAGSYAASRNLLLVPFGLGVVALLIAAMAVQPFLYAALIVEVAVLLSVPVLAPPGKPIGQGVLRFIIFQTLAMPFILLAGWALGGVQANPANTTLVTLSTVFLGLGFAFWLAIFPFYTWIPLLAEHSDPYVSGFILVLLPTVDLLLGLNYLNSFGWLRASPSLFQVIGQIGTLMVVTAGIWAAFQKDLARLLGYGVIVEIGYSLVAIGLGDPLGKQLLSNMFLPRILGLGLWSLSLAILLREARSTRFEDVTGLAQRMPFASAGVAVASLTLGGLPLLAMFPIHQVLLESLARVSFLNSLWVLLGSIGVLFSTFRALAVLAHGTLLPQTIHESRFQIALLLIGIAGLLLIGIFPQLFLPMLNGLTSVYTLHP